MSEPTEIRVAGNRWRRSEDGVWQMELCGNWCPTNGYRDELFLDEIERRDRTIAQYQNALQVAAAEIERLRAAVSAHCAASRPYLVATSELWDVLDG